MFAGSHQALSIRDENEPLPGTEHSDKVMLQASREIKTGCIYKKNRMASDIQ